MFNDIGRLYRYININMARKLDILILPDRKWGVDVQDARDKFQRDNVPKMAEMLDNYLDDCSVQTFYLYRKYLDEKFTNYVPSNPLINVLKEIDVDMKASYLKDGTQGYFELSHANIHPPKHWSSAKITSVLFKVVNDSLLMAVNFEEDVAPTSFFVPLYKGENLSEVLLNLSFKKLERHTGTGSYHKEQNISQEDLTALKLIFNLIIYVSNPNEEFVSQFNEFSKNNKIAQIEKQEYTSKPYVNLGIDAEFLRLVTTDTFDVRGHWRWQPCGVGREQRRLTFIKPHQRTMSKYNASSVSQVE
jgi:hypothetical protein